MTRTPLGPLIGLALLVLPMPGIASPAAGDPADPVLTLRSTERVVALHRSQLQADRGQAFLAARLKDPSQFRARSRMPTLGLSDAQIGDLIAYLGYMKGLKAPVE
jgi:hypothetical protein